MAEPREDFGNKASVLREEAAVRIQDSLAEALAETTAAAVQEINNPAEGFRESQRKRYADTAVETVFQKFCVKQGDTESFKIDIAKMRKSSPLRGSFESNLFALLEGLLERGGTLNGRKINLTVDKSDFHDKPPRAKPFTP